MPLSFPASPSVGATSTQNGRTYTWDGYAWNLSSNVAGHASTHGASGSDPVTIASSQVTGLAAVATSGSAADLSAGTLPDARLSGNIATLAAVTAAANNTTSSADAFSRVFTSSGQIPTSGNVHWTFFSPTSSFTASQISVANINVAVSPTLIRLGLYTADSAGAVTLVARTANDTTIFANASSFSTRSFATAGGYPATYAVTAGSRYALAFCVVASSLPSIPAVLSRSELLWQSPRISAYLTGQSDLPTSVASGGFTTTTLSAVYWMRLS